MREITSGGSVLYFLHADHLGSASLTTNNTGGEVARQSYFPYGSIRAVSGVMPTKIAFTGQYTDDTGLMFFQARYLSPVLGRFISADTIVPGAENPQAFNRYSYVSNNPVKYTDPTGHRECDLEFGCQGGYGSIAAPPAPIADIDPVEEFLPEPYIYIGASPGPIADIDPVEEFWPEPHIFVGASPGPIALIDPPLDNGGIEDLILRSDDGGNDDDDSGSTLRPGPFAGESIPARGQERKWTKEEIEAIDRIGRTTGCHTCGTKDPGTKSGHFVPDHQPASRLNFDNERQRLYPHCLECSRRQGGEVNKYLHRLHFKENDSAG